MRYKAQDMIEGLRYGVAVPPIPKPPVLKPPSYEEIHKAYQDRLGPYVDPQVVDMLARTEYQRYQSPPLGERLSQDAAAALAHPVVQAALAPLRKVEQGRQAVGLPLAQTAGKAVLRGSEVAASDWLGQPVTDAPTTTGKPWLDAGVDVTSRAISTLAQLAMLRQGVSAVNQAKALSPAQPSLVEAEHVSPQLSRSIANALTMTAAHTGMQALKGRPVEPKDVMRSAATMVGGTLGSAAGGAISPHVAALASDPALQTATDVAIRGASAGLGAGLARQPFEGGTIGERVRSVASDMLAMTLFTAASTLSAPQDRQRLLDEVQRIRGDAQALQGAAQTLGLPRLPRSEEELKHAFRSQVRKAHPDTGGSVTAYKQLTDARELARQHLIAVKANLPSRIWNQLMGLFDRSWTPPTAQTQPGKAASRGDEEMLMLPSGEQAQAPAQVIAPRPTPIAAPPPSDIGPLALPPPRQPTPRVNPIQPMGTIPLPGAVAAEPPQEPAPEPPKLQEPEQTPKDPLPAFKEGDRVIWSRPSGQDLKATVVKVGKSGVFVEVPGEKGQRRMYPAGYHQIRHIEPELEPVVAPSPPSITPAPPAMPGPAEPVEDLGQRFQPGQWVKVTQTSGKHTTVVPAKVKTVGEAGLVAEISDATGAVRAIPVKPSDVKPDTLSYQRLERLFPQGTVALFDGRLGLTLVNHPELSGAKQLSLSRDDNGEPVYARLGVPLTDDQARDIAFQVLDRERLYPHSGNAGDTFAATWEFIHDAAGVPRQPVPEWSPSEPPTQPEESAAPASPQTTPVEGPEPSPLSVKKGSAVTAKTERGTEISTNYALVHISDLVPSHDPVRLTLNPAYPSELQPRDRGRAASEAQITHLVQMLEPAFLGASPKASDGAPIVGPDMVVESGNARTMALARSYSQRTPGADRYKQWLIDNAQQFGFESSEVAEMDAPVLVRVRTTPVDRQVFVKEANEQSVAAMSASEQAMSDAERLTDGLLARFQPSEDGELLNAANREFISDFLRVVVGPAEQGRYITSDGSLSQEGINRIRNAVFAKAYGDTSTIEKLAEATDSRVINITGAMLIAAPRYADVQNRIQSGLLHPLALTEEIAAAANKLAILRERRTSVDAYLSQQTLFGNQELTPEATRMLELFHQYGRSRKRLAAILNATVDAVEAAGVPGQGALFGGAVVPTKAEVLEAAVRKVALQYGEDQATLFGAPGQAEDKAISSATPAEADAGYGEEAKAGDTRARASVGRYDLPAEGSSAESELETDLDPYNEDDEFVDADAAQPWTFARAMAGKAKIEDFHPIETPEMADLAKMLTGQMPRIREQLRAAHGQALGMFRVRGEKGSIELRADIFLGPEVANQVSKPLGKEAREAAIEEFRQKVAAESGIDADDLVVRWQFDRRKRHLVFRAYQPNSALAPRVLAHELGHVIDWLPDKELSRGNILGHVATLKRWLTTTIGELPATPDDSLTTEQRAAIHKRIRKSMKGAPSSEIKKAYMKAITDEIKKRGLVTRDEIMDELKILTRRWKPFDPTQSKEYTAYRHSPAELYADAVSMLFNDPKQFARVAPKTASLIVNYSERKPEVRDALEQWQELYEDRDDLSEDRLGHMYRGFEEGRAAHERKAAKASGGDMTVVEKAVAVKDEAVRFFLDKYYRHTKGMDKRRKSQNEAVAQAARNAAAWLTQTRQTASRGMAYSYDVLRLLERLEDVDMDVDDLGVIQTLNRIEHGDREYLANPYGITPQSAQESRAYLERKWGKETFDAVSDASKELHQLREEYFFPLMEELGVVNQDDLEEWQTNPNYTKFSVVKYIEDTYGSQYGGLGLYHQVGTMDAHANPVIETVNQDMRLIDAAVTNKWKHALIQDLKNDPTGVEPARMKYDAGKGRMVPVPPQDRDRALFSYIKDGDSEYFYIDKEIAKDYLDNPHKADAARQLLAPLREIFTTAWIEYNWGWALFNFVRDARGTVQNVEQIRLRDVPKLVRTYFRALPHVHKLVFGQEMTDVMKQGFSEGAIPAMGLYPSAMRIPSEELTQVAEEFMARPKDYFDPSTAQSMIRSGLKVLDKYLRRPGRFTELWGKTSTWMYLDEHHPEISELDRAHIVQTRGSTPDFRHPVGGARLLNLFGIFYPIRSQSVRQTENAFKDNPSRFTWKFIMTSVLPRLMRWAIRIHGANTALKWMVDVFNDASPYDMEHYDIVPGWRQEREDGGYESVYFRFPQHYLQESIGVALDRMLQARFLGKDGGVAALIQGVNPFNWDPFLQLTWQLFTIAVMGENPRDPFYGGTILSDEPQNLSTGEVTKQFAAHAWNQLGGSLIYRAPVGPEIGRQESTLKKLLRLPGLNVLGRFMRVSHDGQTSRLFDAARKIKSERAKTTTDKRHLAIKHINEGVPVERSYALQVQAGLVDPRNESLASYRNSYRRWQTRDKSNPLLQVLYSAQTVDERVAAIEEARRTNPELLADASKEFNLETGVKRTVQSTTSRIIIPKLGSSTRIAAPRF